MRENVFEWASSDNSGGPFILFSSGRNSRLITVEIVVAEFVSTTFGTYVRLCRAPRHQKRIKRFNLIIKVQVVILYQRCSPNYPRGRLDREVGSGSFSVRSVAHRVSMACKKTSVGEV